jgi:anthranilate/para-aminobenzoate synthase component I
LFRPPRCTALASLPAPSDLDPPGALERLRASGMPWLLESTLVLPGSGRYSFAGADPYLVLRSRGDHVTLECRRAAHEGLAPGNARVRTPALAALRAQPARAARGAMHTASSAAARSACSGYELAEQLDVHALHGADDLRLPESVWLFVDALVAFDHERGSAEILGLGLADDPVRARERAERAAHALAEKLAAPAPPTRVAIAGAPPAPASRWHELDVAAYHKAVAAIAEQIVAGALYQACLTYRIDRAFAG